MIKKMIDSSIEERLSLWIVKDHYLAIDSSGTFVEEKKNDGYALVQCILPPGRAYELTLEGKYAAHLVSQKCNDGILLLERPDGEWELHIIECKRTVNKSKWDNTKLQFEATIQRSLSLLSSIGVSPARIKLYTAVRDQEIIDQINADPVLNKMTPAQRRELSIEQPTKLHYMDWFDSSLGIWVQRDIPHQIIPLDENGHGSVTIACL